MFFGQWLNLALYVFLPALLIHGILILRFGPCVNLIDSSKIRQDAAMQKRKNTLSQANFSSLLVRQRQAEWAVKQGQSVETMPPKNCKHSCFFLPHLWAYDGCYR
jgi:hypothetical protein